MPLSIHHPTTPRAWLDFSLEFLLDENRPKNFREILRDEEWRKLCKCWLLNEAKQPEAVKELEKLHEREQAGDWRAALKGLSDSSKKAWPRRMKSFSDFCIKLRAELIANARTLSATSPDWKPYGLDLSFLFKENPPSELTQVIAWADNWQKLFKLWYAKAGVDAAYFDRMIRAQNADNEDFKRATRIQQAHWAKALVLFANACDNLRTSGAAEPTALLGLYKEWLPDMDLGFLLKESQPTSIVDLLSRNEKTWRALFADWGRRAGDEWEEYLTLKADWDSDQAKAEDRIRTQSEYWSKQIEYFRVDCGKLSKRLSTHLGAVAKANPKMSSRQVEAQAQRQRETKARTDQAIKNVRSGDLGTIIELEATLFANTREVTRKTAQIHAQLKVSSNLPAAAHDAFNQARTVIEGPIFRLQSAEAALREATTTVRPKVGKENDVTPDHVAALRNAWTGYVRALTEVVAAPPKASEIVVNWVISDTVRKTNQNIAAVRSVLDTVLPSVETAMRGFGALNYRAKLAGLSILSIGTEYTEMVDLAIDAGTELVTSTIGRFKVAGESRGPGQVKAHPGRRDEKPGRGRPSRTGRSSPDDPVHHRVNAVIHQLRREMNTRVAPGDETNAWLRAQDGANYYLIKEDKSRLSWDELAAMGGPTEEGWFVFESYAATKVPVEATDPIYRVKAYVQPDGGLRTTITPQAAPVETPMVQVLTTPTYYYKIEITGAGNLADGDRRNAFERNFDQLYHFGWPRGSEFSAGWNNGRLETRERATGLIATDVATADFRLSTRDWSVRPVDRIAAILWERLLESFEDTGVSEITSTAVEIPPKTTLALRRDPNTGFYTVWYDNTPMWIATAEDLQAK
ncbi:hypothetical protein [Amycolatopsis sp. cmx-4-61]|uniref:hypothetical protein n=1 Tax=Amycolatopsis sp. cmx-4-61 TaxID=2790937 RepID=UPI00397A896E